MLSASLWTVKGSSFSLPHIIFVIIICATRIIIIIIIYTTSNFFTFYLSHNWHHCAIFWPPFTIIKTFYSTLPNLFPSKFSNFTSHNFKCIVISLPYFLFRIENSLKTVSIFFKRWIGWSGWCITLLIKFILMLLSNCITLDLSFQRASIEILIEVNSDEMLPKSLRQASSILSSLVVTLLTIDKIFCISET